MGVGKTTFGKKLANKLSYTFVDTDQLIEQKEGMEIHEIFKTKGETYFRTLEAELINNLDLTKPLVVSTGGGLPCFNNLIDVLLLKGKVIHLDIPVKVMVNRLMNAKTKRPLIEGKSEEQLESFISHTLAYRNQFYQQANYTFDTRDVSSKKLDEFVKTLV
jgi:shikimate kinase